jgi:hypothetical protein
MCDYYEVVTYGGIPFLKHFYLFKFCQ